MDERYRAGSRNASQALPTPVKLAVGAIAIPFFVAATNQLLVEEIAAQHNLSFVLYPWLALSTAVLSLSTGRLLSPAWLRWTVFAWGLVLLDLIVFIACVTNRVDRQFGYILVSAQISLLTLWGVLGPGRWQWRLPLVAAMAPLVVSFCGTFVGTYSRYTSRSWNLMMFVTAVIVVLLCGGLRYLGFTLRPKQIQLMTNDDSAYRPSYQFGVKHMLIWLTVTGPLLLFIRGLDLGGRGFFTGAVLAIALSTVNLLAIWAVLGEGHWLIRLVSLIGMPPLIAFGMTHYSAYLKANAAGMNTRGGFNWYGTVGWALVEMETLWTSWLWLDAALLAALLLYLRAIGYRLMRSGQRSASEPSAAAPPSIPSS